MSNETRQPKRLSRKPATVAVQLLSHTEENGQPKTVYTVGSVFPLVETIHGLLREVLGNGTAFHNVLVAPGQRLRKELARGEVYYVDDPDGNDPVGGEDIYLSDFIAVPNSKASTMADSERAALTEFGEWLEGARHNTVENCVKWTLYEQIVEKWRKVREALREKPCGE